MRALFYATCTYSKWFIHLKICTYYKTTVKIMRVLFISIISRLIHSAVRPGGRKIYGERIYFAVKRWKGFRRNAHILNWQMYCNNGQNEGRVRIKTSRFKSAWRKIESPLSRRSPFAIVATPTKYVWTNIMTRASPAYPGKKIRYEF